MKSPRSRSLKTKLIESFMIVVSIKNFTYLEDYKMENLQKALGFSLVLILGLMSLAVVACQSPGAKTVEDLPTQITQSPGFAPMASTATSLAVPSTTT